MIQWKVLLKLEQEPMSTPEEIPDFLRSVREEWNNPTNRYLRFEAMERLIEQVGAHPDPISDEQGQRYYVIHVYTGVCAMLSEFETYLCNRELAEQEKHELISACHLIARLYQEQVILRRRARKQNLGGAKKTLSSSGDDYYLKDIQAKRQLRIETILGRKS